MIYNESYKIKKYNIMFVFNSHFYEIFLLDENLKIKNENSELY